MKTLWIKKVKAYIMCYPNIPRAQKQYEKLLKFAEENNLDFSKNLEGAIKHLEKNEVGLSFRYSLHGFLGIEADNLIDAETELTKRMI